MGLLPSHRVVPPALSGGGTGVEMSWGGSRGRRGAHKGPGAWDEQTPEYIPAL